MISAAEALARLRDGNRRFVAERMLSRLRLPAFRAFVVAIVGLGLAASVFPFLSLLVRDRLGEGERFLGLLGAVLMAGNLAHSWVIGVVTDRRGSRVGLVVALVAIGLGTLGCLLFHERAMLLACYFLAAAWMPAQFVSATDLGLRLAPGAPPAEVFATMMAVMSARLSSRTRWSVKCSAAPARCFARLRRPSSTSQMAAISTCGIFCSSARMARP